jgi:hypothetical protein
MLPINKARLFLKKIYFGKLKMKLIIFFEIILATASVAIASRPVVNLSKSKVENNMSLDEMFLYIISDPNFLALDINKQLHVLIVIYNILETNRKKMLKGAKNGGAKQRR